MRRGIVGLALCLIVVALPAAQAPYYPPPGQWAHKTPAEVGMDAANGDGAQSAQGFKKVTDAITESN